MGRKTAPKGGKGSKRIDIADFVAEQSVRLGITLDTALSYSMQQLQMLAAAAVKVQASESLLWLTLVQRAASVGQTKSGVQDLKKFAKELERQANG